MGATQAAGIATGHVGLNVRDLERSKQFYQAIFGFEVAEESSTPGREFVLLGHGGSLVLTLWKQATSAFATDRAGLHHLSFRVESIDDVSEAEGRVRRAGAHVFHGGIVPHAEGSESGGLFFEDPDGVRLEIFAESGAGGMRAPVSNAPTCGFF